MKSNTHKTDTEVKTGVRLRMSVRDDKPQETEAPKTKSRKSNGPKGNPADRRNRKRATVAATREEVRRKRENLSVEWVLVNGVALINSYVAFRVVDDTATGIMLALSILALLVFYNRRAFQNMDDLNDKKEIR